MEDFASDYSEPKIIDIVQKTWKKMSERGRQKALELPLPESVGSIVEKALA